MGRNVISRSDWLLGNLVGRQPRQRKPLVIQELNFCPVASNCRVKAHRPRQSVTDLSWFGEPKGRLLRERGLPGLRAQNGWTNQGGAQKQEANRTHKHSIIGTLLAHIYAEFQIATLLLQASVLQFACRSDELILP